MNIPRKKVYFKGFVPLYLLHFDRCGVLGSVQFMLLNNKLQNGCGNGCVGRWLIQKQKVYFNHTENIRIVQVLQNFTVYKYVYVFL